MALGAVSAAAGVALLVLSWMAPAGANDPLQAMGVLRPAAPAPAPAIAFVTLDGREVSVRDLRGKAVLLGFFATW